MQGESTWPWNNTPTTLVHGDLLEMKEMEPRHIKHYTKKEEFLEEAQCAGDCKQTIMTIVKASPKANIYYCDIANKGFYAPEDDPAKANMECGLVLCSPCRAIRAVTYDLKNAKDGTVNKRPSRRVNKRS